jgi:hypothetical protein
MLFSYPVDLVVDVAVAVNVADADHARVNVNAV